MFEIPIVLFIFKRPEKTVKILEQISKIYPSKIYLIGDGPRSMDEREDVINCRKIVEQNVPNNCELVTNYVETNRGVYENIAGGAKWVFKKEKWAIFLEDDNMPELSFFPFCNELLHKYEHDTRILWICGTNYLREYDFPNCASYGFTQNMMPCGWASWSGKFLKFYEGDLSLWNDVTVKNAIKSLPYYSILKKQDMNNWDMEIDHLRHFGRFSSWDYQMSFTIRVHNLLGIVPRYNQITNIGVDNHSIHGGISFDNTMTRRFCGIPTKSLDFPLKHPSNILPDKTYENLTSKIISLPWKMRMKECISSFLKKIFNINRFDSFTSSLKEKIQGISL